MTGLAITITDKGRAALVAASGTNAVTISTIGISAASVTPTATATTLPGEIKRLATFAGTVTDADTIHITIRDDSTDSYALRAFALYLSDGTLFGLYGGADLIMEKATGSMLMLAVDIQITGSDVTAIKFGDTNFLNPAATTEVQGVVELATEAEATTGTDTKRAVTPKGMMAAVKSWLDDRLGAGAPSVFIKGLLASASAAALRTALEIKSAALQEASAFAAASHSHTIANVTNLQTTLDAKLASSSYTAADVLAKLVTVDGSGSGLDADTLDGQDGSYYMRSTFAGDADLNALTDSGVYRLNSSNGNAPPNLAWGQVLVMHGGADTAIQIACSYNTPNLYFRSGAGAPFSWGAWYTFWNSGNDGSGSGMDADMLDGQHGAYYTDILGRLGYTPVNKASYTAADVLAKLQGVDGSGSGMDADMLDGRHASDFALINGAGFSGSVTAQRFATGWDSGVDYSFSCSNWFRSCGNTGWLNATYGGGWYMSDTTWIRAWGDKGVYTPDVMRADRGFNIGGNYWCFHSGMDGSGSGMDADMLDGRHASDFALAATAPSVNNFTNDVSTHGEAGTVWSGDEPVTIRTGQALVIFTGNWRTNTGPYYAQLYVDGAAWPGAWTHIGAMDGSDDVMTTCTIQALVTGLSAGNHTFAVKRTTGSTLTVYGGGSMTVLQV